jgi:hypothetical protein
MAPVHPPFRPLRTSAPAIGLALALVVVLAACGGGSKKGGSGTSDTTVPKVLSVKTSVLTVGTVDVESAGPTNQIDTATGKAVLAVAQAYIDNAVFAPLRTGQLGAAYASMFDTPIKASATGADQHSLTDIDAGKATSLTTKATKVNLSALEGTLGELMYVGTNFDLTLKATTDGQPLTITHHVELTFAQTGKTWLITAYRVQTVRTLPKATTTTTATAGTTTP